MTRKREILETLESLFSVFFLFAPRGFRAKHNDGVCLSCSLFNIMFTTFLQSLIPFTLHDVFRVELNLSRFITMLALFVVMFTSGLQKCPNSTKIFGGHGKYQWTELTCFFSILGSSHSLLGCLTSAACPPHRGQLPWPWQVKQKATQATSRTCGPGWAG